MSGLARYALKGAPQAALIAAVFLTLSLLFPPFAWFSSAVIGLVTLRKGWQHGLVVISLATAGTLVLFMVTLGGWKTVPALESIFWLPVFLMAATLRAFVKLELSLLLAGVLGFVGLSLVFIIQGDPSAVWLELLRKMMEAEVWATQFQVSPEEFDNFLIEISTLMPGSTVACLVFSAIVSLLLARSWQAKLYNPGGFQTEYHQLRYGRQAAIVVLVVTGASLLMQTSYTFGLLSIMLVVYVFQGAAIIHALAKLKSISIGWLVGLYVLCAMLPQVAVILGGVGIADAWWDSRKRLAAKMSAE